jgi:hypothetical protein
MDVDMTSREFTGTTAEPAIATVTRRYPRSSTPPNLIPAKVFAESDMCRVFRIRSPPKWAGTLAEFIFLHNLVAIPAAPEPTVRSGILKKSSHACHESV